MFGLVKAGVSLIWMCCLPPLRYLATAWKLLLRSDGPLYVSRFPSCRNYVSDSQGEINTTRHIFSVVSHLPYMQMRRCGRGWMQVKNGQSYDCQKIRDVFCWLFAVSLSPAALRKPLTHLPPAKSNYISVKRLSLSLSTQWLFWK